MKKNKITKTAMVASALVPFLASCGSGGSSSNNSTIPCNALGSQMISTGATSPVSGAHPLVSPPGMSPLIGHVPLAVSSASDQGAIAPSTVMPVTVALTLNNPQQLASDLAEIYDPTSPSFHRFMTPEEFHARYGPTDAQISQVENYLGQAGFSSVSVDDNRMLVHAKGTAQTISSTFQTQIHNYKSATGNAFHAPNTEPLIPSGLPITAIHGLQSLTVAHPHIEPLKSGAVAHGGSGPGGGYAPSDFRTAYNVPSALNGSGQSIALFELDGYTASDITAYEQQFSLAAASLQNVYVDGTTGSAGSGAAEVTLDIELALAMAPGIQKIYVYEGPNSEQGMLDVYSKIASDNLAKEVSTSWGSDEGSAGTALIQSENTIFMQMAAQGQTIFSAAGDSGADDNGSSLSVDDPSSQPYVVGVGGTSLTLGSGAAYGSETAWNDGGGAGGGGVSSVWTIPSWQQATANAQAASSKGSTTMRNVPDVSLNADPTNGYAIYEGGSWGVWGGTSAAAPLWAGMTALLNQARAVNGLSPIGLITPLLYTLGNSSSYGQDFHDIADGSTNGYYPAVKGYDDATGWGSYDATALIGSLSADPSSGGPGPASSCP